MLDGDQKGKVYIYIYKGSINFPSETVYGWFESRGLWMVGFSIVLVKGENEQRKTKENERIEMLGQQRWSLSSTKGQ